MTSFLYRRILRSPIRISLSVPFLPQLRRVFGCITVDDYDKYVTKYKAEMEDLDRKLIEYTNNDKIFELTSAYLLELASKAKRIFESSQPEQKNKILRILLANPTSNEKRLQLPLLNPFSVLIDTLKTQIWLPMSVLNLEV